jgi:hypothetical protein
MSRSKTWHLSQGANKDSGIYSECLNVGLLHLKDGLVHRHGPRHNACAGSHKPPLAVTSSQTDLLTCSSQLAVASSDQSDLAGAGLPNQLNLKYVTFDVTFFHSVTGSVASASPEAVGRDHPDWFSFSISGIIERSLFLNLPDQCVLYV